MSAMSTNFQRRKSTKMVNSEDAFPTLYHRIMQPKPPPPRLVNGLYRSLHDSVFTPSSSFPALSRFFGTFLVAAHLPFVKAGGISEELSNNIIADLAPFLALFGEQVTKQFMGQSMGVTDNIIFAAAPLGIITAIVGAIRVGGSRSLRAIIGRARESRSAVEIELMSSTSVDVCEMWDGKGVVKALGAAPIIELIYLIPKESKYGMVDAESQKIFAEGDFGIYDFDSAKLAVLELQSPNHVHPQSFNDIELQSLNNPDDSSSTAPLMSGNRAAPNMSLNFGGDVVRDVEVYAVAALGVILQLGVIVYTVLSFSLSPWKTKFQKAGYEPTIYAPLMICGTLVLAIGMYLCSHIVERSTVEGSWNVKDQTLDKAQVKIAWLQQGGVVGDQVFDSYALFPIDPLQRNSPTNIQKIRGYYLSLDRLLSRVSRGFGKVMRFFCIRFRFGIDNWFKNVMGFFLQKYLFPVDHSRWNLRGWIMSRLFVTGIGCLQTTSWFRNYRFHWNPRRWTVYRWFTNVIEFFQKKLRARHAPQKFNQSSQVFVRTSRQIQTAPPHTLVNFAVFVSLSGFVGQFLGLRGLHWSVTVSQLVVTCIMTVLRASIRRNILQDPKTEKLHLGYELDWMARVGINKCAHWSVVTWGFNRPSHFGGETPVDTLATATMSVRRRLAALSKWPNQWCEISDSTATAIEECMNFMFYSVDITVQGDWTERDRFEWTIVVQVGLQEPRATHLEEVTLTLKRTKLFDGAWGPWRAVRSEVEAVIGLWMLHFEDLKPDAAVQSAAARDWQNDDNGSLRGKPILRVLGPYNALERMCYENWIGRQTNYVKVIDIKTFTEAKTCDMAMAGFSGVSEHGVPALGVITTTKLERICAQVLFSQFMLNMADLITIGGDVNIRQGVQGVKTSFGLSFVGLTGLVEIMEQTTLASTEEAYMSIFPAVSGFGKLPHGPDDNGALFHEIVNAANSNILEGRLEQAECCRLWLLHVAELAANVYKHRKDWSRAGDVYLDLQRESANLLHGTDHIEDVNQRIALFCEQVFAAIAIGGRMEGGQSMLSETLGLVGGCMTKIFGQISQATLARWTSSAEGGSPAGLVKEWPLCDAAKEGKGFLVEVLLEDGADIDGCAGDCKTPLILACLYGHASIAGQLIMRDANINAADYGGQTPLHHASQMGHTLVVQMLLAFGGVTINARDKMGFSSLDLAIQQNVGGVVRLLLFYGAEDRDRQARKLVHVAAENGSEAAVSEMLKKEVDLNLVDAEYGRSPIHWATWNASGKSLECLLAKGVNPNAIDNMGDTPFHVAVMAGWMMGIECLLKWQNHIDLKGNNGETFLHIAASLGNMSVVQLLLSSRANIEATDDMGHTPLLLATANGRKSTVQLLLVRGANMDVKSARAQKTPLHVAVENGHFTTVEVLLLHGADKEAKDHSEMTPLYVAAQNGHSATVKLLLDEGADKEAIDVIKNTPLYAAAQNGHLATLKLLIDKGANQEAKNSQGMTPLHAAAQHGHQATVTHLLTNGANMEANNNAYETPLYSAAAFGHQATVKVLLDEGADKGSKRDGGLTPLHAAAENGHSATVKVLLDEGADKDAKCNYKTTPLHVAAKNGHLATVKFLIDMGADIKVQDSTQQTPLHCAARGGQLATVKFLLGEGANMEAKDDDEKTPLHSAAGNGHLATVRLLLDKGAYKEGNNYRGMTILHAAAQNGHLATVKFLLDEGGNKEGKDRLGQAPLHFAAGSGHFATVKFLLDMGADMEVQDKYQETPLHYAAGSGQLDTVKLLLDIGANLEAKNSMQRTPLHRAAHTGRVATVQLLLDRGGDKLAADTNEDLPINLARESLRAELWRQFRRSRQEYVETIVLLEGSVVNANCQPAPVGSV